MTVIRHIVIGADQIPSEELKDVNVGELVAISVKNDGVYIVPMIGLEQLEQARLAQSAALAEDGLESLEGVNVEELDAEQLAELEAHATIAEQETIHRMDAGATSEPWDEEIVQELEAERSRSRADTGVTR